MLVTVPKAQGKMLFTQTAEPLDEAIILPTSSVDITDVSRMGFDLRRKAVVGDRNKVDPDEADERFVGLLVKLLEKVSRTICDCTKPTGSERIFCSCPYTSSTHRISLLELHISACIAPDAMLINQGCRLRPSHDAACGVSNTAAALKGSLTSAC